MNVTPKDELGKLEIVRITRKITPRGKLGKL